MDRKVYTNTIKEESGREHHVLHSMTSAISCEIQRQHTTKHFEL